MTKKLILAMALILVLICVLVITFEFQSVEADGTITIRVDGNIDPEDAPILNSGNVTYTLEDNIDDTIVVERSHVIIDGAGYTVFGSGGWGAGIGVQNNAHNVTIQNVNIMSFGFGIGIMNSRDNTITGNNISNSACGIFLNSVRNSTFSGNKITKNARGVWLQNSSDNKFYHNYFINNTNQVYVEPSKSNFWDDDFPSGGNYWSEYEDKYPDATEIDGSGIWNTPYDIDELNQDNFPIVPELPSFMLKPLFMLATLLAAIVYGRKQIKLR